jgi:hypothetical protein
MAAPQKRTVCLLFAASLFTYCYVWQITSSDNSMTRAASTIALILDHSFRIDDYARDLINDKAVVQGHIYSDKAPGLSIAALPSMALTHFLLNRFTGVNRSNYLPLHGLEPGDRHLPSSSFRLLTLVGTMSTSAPATALAVAALFCLSQVLGASRTGAFIGSLSFGLASPAFGWASAFFGHALAGALLFLGYASSFRLVLLGVDRQVHLLRWTLPGFLLGYSVLTEFTCAVPAILIGVLSLVEVRQRDWRSLLNCLTGLALGALPSAAFLLAYNTLCFGSPFSLGYHHVVDFPEMQQGLLGVTFPRLWVLLALVFSPRRGILWISPILILVPWSFFYALGDKDGRSPGPRRRFLLLAALIVAYFFLLNASYAYWDGGTSVGPRHVTPCLAFAFLPFGVFWDKSRRSIRYIVCCLFVLSIATAGLCALTSMIEDVPRESFSLLDSKVVSFLEGRVRTLPLFFGIRGLQTLVPLLVVWGAALFFSAEASERVLVKRESN